MHAAGVISHHAAQRTAAVRRGIGAEGQVVLFRSAAQMIENHTRLDSSLAGQCCNVAVVLPANRDCRYYIVRVFGKDNSDRNLAVVGAVGGVEGTAAVVEPDFAT